MDGRNIVLIGFMGSGKTTIGRKLAAKLDYRFVDMDIEIETKAGMKITEIFSKYGEAEFRKMESRICEELSKAKNCVIATGGGVIKNDKNMELLKENGIVLYIKATPEHVYRNIKNDTTRPLLQCEDKLAKIKELMEERKPLYESKNDITFDVSGLNAKEAVERIMSVIEGDSIL